MMLSKGLSPEKRELLRILLTEERIEKNLSKIKPFPRDKYYYPLSYGQQRLWILSQLDPLMFLTVYLLLQKSMVILIYSILEECIRKIINRHEVLRTNFIEINGTPVQVIKEKIEFFFFNMIDISNQSKENLELEIKKISSELSRIPFDLQSGPLLHSTIIKGK